MFFLRIFAFGVSFLLWQYIAVYSLMQNLLLYFQRRAAAAIDSLHTYYCLLHHGPLAKGAVAGILYV